MKTIRRLYFYLVALISLEVVIWGLINLLRTMFSSGLTFPGADTLAQALALIFVGIPIFAAHWLWAQRAASRDPEEASASLRAVFLYAALLGTLIPVVQNLLALINRTLVVSAGIDSYRAFLGGSQTWIDNTIAIVLNLIAAAYFFNILRSEWETLPDQSNFADVRRLYRFVWVFYALLMTVFGSQQIVRFVFYLPAQVLGAAGREMFVNGLALVLVGTPIWVYTWDLCQRALEQPAEQRSSMRLVVLYILSLVGVITVLTTSGLVVNLVLMRLLGDPMEWREWISRVGGPFSVGVPLAVVWAYYGRWLNNEIGSYADEIRRASLKRIYLYILALIGLVATFTGLALLLSFMVAILTGNALWGTALRPRLSGSVATLLAGLPLWLAAWRPLQAEALSSGDLGDHARRSLVRRGFLYLAIFATVIGGMASAIYLVYTLLFGLLDHRTPSFLNDVFNGLQLLALFVAFLIYHLSVLRHDGGSAADSLAARQARFSVLIFESQGQGFAAPLVAAISHISTSIPVAVQPVEQGIPDGASTVQAVVIPASLALDPPEALRLWLKEFTGSKLVVPADLPGWYWPGGIARNSAGLTAQMLRQLAEGQEVRTAGGTPAWMGVVYVFAALFTLELFFLLVSLGMSLVVR